MRDSPIHEASFRIRYHEAGADLRVKPVALFQLLQEAAISHATAGERSPLQVAGRGWAWFLLRFHLEIARFPGWDESIRVQTWPSRLEGLYARREYRIVGADGAVAANATSLWIVISLRQRRPVRIPAWIQEAFEVIEQRALDDPFDDLSPRGKTAADGPPMAFRVRESDLDFNGHANSAAYLDWLLESVPREIQSGNALRSVEIAFLREIQGGETVLAISNPVQAPGDEDRLFESDLRKNDGTLLAAGRSVWTSTPG